MLKVKWEMGNAKAKSERRRAKGEKGEGRNDQWKRWNVEGVVSVKSADRHFTFTSKVILRGFHRSLFTPSARRKPGAGRPGELTGHPGSPL